LEELAELMAEGDELVEVDRRPFKRANAIGPGPRGGWGHAAKHKKRDYWKCKCSKYKCRCVGKEGEKKKVKLSPEYKSDYNSEYKQWARAALHKAAPGMLGRTKKEKARKKKNRATLQAAANKRRKYKKKKKK
jgi:hypothetical protein